MGFAAFSGINLQPNSKIPLRPLLTGLKGPPPLHRQQTQNRLDFHRNHWPCQLALRQLLYQAEKFRLDQPGQTLESLSHNQKSELKHKPKKKQIEMSSAPNQSYLLFEGNNFTVFDPSQTTVHIMVHILAEELNSSIPHQKMSPSSVNA